MKSLIFQDSDEIVDFIRNKIFSFFLSCPSTDVRTQREMFKVVRPTPPLLLDYKLKLDKRKRDEGDEGYEGAGTKF